MMRHIAHRMNTGNNFERDATSCLFRYDLDSTQPAGISYYMSTGNIAKAMISVFGVSEG